MFDPRYITTRRVQSVALILIKPGFAAFWPEAGQLMGNDFTTLVRLASRRRDFAQGSRCGGVFARSCTARITSAAHSIADMKQRPRNS
jgi:hypothetical protein